MKPQKKTTEEDDRTGAIYIALQRHSAVAMKSSSLEYAEANCRLHQIDWRVPTVMVSCFVLSILGAIGHHLFYV